MVLGLGKEVVILNIPDVLLDPGHHHLLSSALSWRRCWAGARCILRSLDFPKLSSLDQFMVISSRPLLDPVRMREPEIFQH